MMMRVGEASWRNERQIFQNLEHCGCLFSRPPPPAPTLLPSQPLCLAIRDSVNELGAWAAYKNQHQTINNAYLNSLDSLMRGMAMQMGLDTISYPQPPVFPPPFQFQYAYPPTADPKVGVPPPEEEDL